MEGAVPKVRYEAASVHCYDDELSVVPGCSLPVLLLVDGCGACFGSQSKRFHVLYDRVN